MLKTTQPLPPDWYETFEARGQSVQDVEDLMADRLPSDPRAASTPEPTAPATSSPKE